MDAPVFRLEGVVKTVDESSDFEGPLALILLLLSKDKIEIRDISISLILEQYLAYMAELTELNLDIASDFVAMASHLTYIKTKMLLSGGEEVTELEQLISSLEELQRGDTYLQIKMISEVLSGMFMRGGAMMAGPPEYLEPDSEFVYEHECQDLLEAVLEVIGRENAVLSSRNPKQATYPRRITYTISEKIAQILERLKENGDMSVRDMFFHGKSRAEIVAMLIAVLELCRAGVVLLTGSADETVMSYTGTGREPLAADIDDGWGT
jgi:segregation and condensation protein A